MRYWFDTEFHENGKAIDLISIGVVADDGREYYAVSTAFNKVSAFAHPWLLENVLPHLPWEPRAPGEAFTWVTAEPRWEAGIWKSRDTIRRDLLEFCDPEQYGKPEFWAYYADYDWVVLCQLFGTMMGLPENWPMYCRDVKQLADMLGKPKLPEQIGVEHDALADARWNKLAWTFLYDRLYDIDQADVGAIIRTSLP